jgi:hypothetical protein
MQEMQEMQPHPEKLWKASQKSWAQLQEEERSQDEVRHEEPGGL